MYLTDGGMAGCRSGRGGRTVDLVSSCALAPDFSSRYDGVDRLSDRSRLGFIGSQSIMTQTKLAAEWSVSPPAWRTGCTETDSR